MHTLSNIQVNIILTSMSRSPNWSLPFSFIDLATSHICEPSHACYIPFSAHSHLYCRPKSIWWTVYITSIKWDWTL